MNVESIISALEARRCGSGWIARCPAHDDRNPSLSITEADEKILVYCHAGCSQSDVIEALRARDLWPERSAEKSRQIVAIYEYRTDKCELLYEIIRYEPKDFSQRRPDGSGGWTWKKSPHQVLYRLPEVLAAPIVFVVEGEKDVETLRAYGFVATTNAGGAKTRWLPQYTAALQNKEVILIPDNDLPGRQRVLTIARALIGVAAKIIMLELEDAHDASDWFARGHSELELIARVEDEEAAR